MDNLCFTIILYGTRLLQCFSYHIQIVPIAASWTPCFTREGRSSDIVANFFLTRQHEHRKEILRSGPLISLCKAIVNLVCDVLCVPETACSVKLSLQHTESLAREQGLKKLVCKAHLPGRMSTWQPLAPPLDCDPVLSSRPAGHF